MNLNNKKQKKIYIIFAVSVTLLLILCRVSLSEKLTTRQYTFASEHVKEEHTFVVLTDLHSTYYGKNQQKLVSAIDEYAPEAIFLVGDISEDDRNFDGTAALLEQIAPKYPCYYVTGNHERWVYYTDDIKALFESYGVNVLSGTSIDFGDGITISGIDDPMFYTTNEEFCAALATIENTDDRLDILLSHRPEFAELYSELGFDLTICGHAHGGQVRLPFSQNGLYAPHQGIFPSYSGGKFDFGSSSVIVSRGLMKDELPRVFNPPELVVLNVRPNN